ncbi:MAG TPA: DUF4175 family protein [Patescibacteria group bacterium]|nr:DUF4175 family protein [Patescibacteria group bacterium]
MNLLRYRLVLFFSWLSLFAERFWASFWPAVSVVFAFIGFAAMRFFTAFGNNVHLALLALFAILFAVALLRLGAPFRRPTMREVRRAVERESGLAHRPLEALLDKPVTGTPKETALLWQKYQSRLRSIWARTRIHRPRPAVRDRYSLRHAALLLLIVGLAIGQRDTLFRLQQALNPDVKSYLHLNAAALDVWITPPDYTQENPIFLATNQLGAKAINGGVQVPENSILKVRVGGFDSAPALTYGTEKPEFTQAAPKSFTLEMPLKTSAVLKLKKWWVRSLGEWPITVIKDRAPGIVLLQSEATKRQQLKLTYTAKDDYRIKQVWGTISPTPELMKTFGTKTLNFDLPAPDSGSDEKTYVSDMTSHPWAGSKVMLTLNAEDDAEQTGSSEPQKVLLPERQFTNPTAKRIIVERRKLIWYNNALTRTLSTQALLEIASNLEGYKYDKKVFLGLTVAYKRLMYDGSAEAATSLVPLLWDLAIRVEDGGLALAQRELSDALQKLSEKLKDKNATKEEIQDLVNEVQRKMQEYTQNLAQDMKQRMMEGQTRPNISQELADRIMKQVDMQKLMQQMQDLQSGSEAEQMQKMAEYLKNNVDRMDPKNMDRMQQGQKNALQGLEELQKLIERQQQLIDKTQKLSPQKPEQKNPEEQPAPNEQKTDAQQQPKNEQGQQQQDKQQQGDKTGDQQQDKQQQGDKSGQQQQQQQGDQGKGQGSQGQEAAQQGQQQGRQGEQPGQQPAQQQGQGSQPGQQGTSQGQQGQAQGQQQGSGNGSDKGQLPQPSPASDPNAPKNNAQGGGGQEKIIPVPQAGKEGQPLPQQAEGGDQQQQQPSQGEQAQSEQAQPKQGKDAGPPVRNAREGAQEQGTLRGKLGEIMRKIGEGLPEVPENFGKADQYMKGAVKELKEGDSSGSLPHQREALKELEGAMDNATKQLAEQLQQTMMNFGMPQDGPGYGQGFDPLGRRQYGKQDGPGSGDDFVQIPEERERRRVQQIIEELRTRSNDYTRPKQEREYIDRLLNQFE